MLTALATIGFLSLAVAATSFTITKAQVFRTLRGWIDDRNGWLGDLVHCPYCVGHWLSFAAVLIYQPRVVHSGVLLLDLFVSAMATVALATGVVGLIWRSLIAMEPLRIPAASNGTPSSKETTHG